MSQTASGPEVDNPLVADVVRSNGESRKTLAPEETLPRRDVWLLPLVVILVVVVVLGASELVARRLFPERGRFSCGQEAGSGGHHFKANCVMHYKNPEGPDVEYRFNECGYRSGAPCGPKAPGTLRVVLMGTSVTMGLYVPEDQTLAARIEKTLGGVCRRRLEVENLGAIVDMASQPEVVDEAIGLSPDVVVLTVSPYDVEESPPANESKPQPLTISAKSKDYWRRLKLRIRNSSFVLAAVHFSLLNEQILYHVFLGNGASRDLMSSPPTPGGDRMYSDFSAILGRMMPKLRSAGIPVVVVAVPNRAAAAMVSNHSRVEGIDPWLFGRRISEIARQQGALPVDVTSRFATSPHAERLFYAVDNHPKGAAHALIADALLEHLTSGSILQMAPCGASPP